MKNEPPSASENHGMGTNLVQDTNTSNVEIYNTYLVQSLLLLEGKSVIKSLHWLPILRKEVFKKFLSGIHESWRRP